jgi:hypothetical protein
MDTVRHVLSLCRTDQRCGRRLGLWFDESVSIFAQILFELRDRPALEEADELRTLRAKPLVGRLIDAQHEVTAAACYRHVGHSPLFRVTLLR